MSQNRRFLISELEKIVRLLLLSQATTAKSDEINTYRYFSYIYISCQMYVTWGCVMFYYY